jgi:hypothetical protein
MQPRHRFLLATGLAALVATSVAIGIAAATPGVLHVEEVRFLKARQEGGNLSLDAISYITSQGGTSRDVRVVAYLYPQATGIADQRVDTHVGRVAGGGTEEVTIPLRLVGFDPDRAGSWAVDFLIFEDGLLTQKGHGAIGYHGPPAFEERGLLSSLDASAGPFQRAG